MGSIDSSTPTLSTWDWDLTWESVQSDDMNPQKKKQQQKKKL